MNIELQSMAIELPRVADHPNRAPFRGVLTLLDVPSDRPPAGARGHRVLLTRAAAENALPSLLGMGLDYAPALDRHDAQRKVGVITEAEIVPAAEEAASGAKAPKTAGALTAGLKPCSTRVAGKLGAVRAGVETSVGKVPALQTRIEVAGYLYARDFPEVMRELRRRNAAGGGRATHALGMSYEIADARIDDLRAGIWTVNECTFTGAAVLRRDKAAYAATWIELI